MEDAAAAVNFEVVAAASRDLPRARDFASSHQIPRAYGSYRELFADREIDAVYISVPNSLHHEVTIQALRAGKHVLAEKPYSRHPEQVDEAFEVAESAGLLLMEGLMWRHSAQTCRFVELLPQVGELRSIRSTFSFVMTAKQDIRLQPALEGGAVMDLGCYVVSAARLAAGAEPIRVYSKHIGGPTGVDVQMSSMLTFPSGVVAQLQAGFGSTQRSLEAVGSAGTLTSYDPFLGKAGRLDLNGEPHAFEPLNAYRLEMENLSAAILGRGRPLLGRADAMGQALTIDALFRSAATDHAVSVEGRPLPDQSTPTGPAAAPGLTK